jgi:enamine deaminase RidA (YjgF/YER057c/UK114 family)
VLVHQGECEHDDPLGGAFGAARAVRAGDFVFTSAVTGSTGLVDGVPQFPATFDEQLLVVGHQIRRRLERFGCDAADIVDAVVWLHPSVDLDPGELLDRLHDDVFGGTAPALSAFRAENLYAAVLISIKVVAYKPRP